MTIADFAESIVGKSRDDLGLHESTEWCAETVSYILKNTVDPAGEFHSISCNDMIMRMRRSNKVIEPDGLIQRNDIFFFDHDRSSDPLRNSKPLDHVAVVTSCDGETLEYVDGNGDSSGIVRKRSRKVSEFNFDCQYPDYYMRFIDQEEPAEQPAESKVKDWELPVLGRGEFGKSVRILQTILAAEKFNIGKYGVDGDYGPDTENAVKTYQNAVGLPQTGVCDLNTWKSLLI